MSQWVVIIEEKKENIQSPPPPSPQGKGVKGGEGGIRGEGTI